MRLIIRDLYSVFCIFTKYVFIFWMKKLVFIISLLLIVVFAGATSHKSTAKHRSSKSHSKSYTHHKTYSKPKVDTRPELTLKDVQIPNKLWGIDISHYQADINWLALSDERPNFMFIKASEGINLKDEKYASYYDEASKLGIPVGSYHFFSYKSSGKEQAENFLSVAKHKNGDLLPVLDAEYTKSMPEDKSKIKAELIDFVTTIYQKLGSYPIIYCNHRYFQTYLAETILQANCKLWIVDYKNEPICNWTLWQSTDKLKLAAIKGHVDLNFFNGDLESLKNILYKAENGQFF